MKLADGVRFITGKNGGKFPFSNSLLVADKLLIDAGCGIELVKELAGRVDAAVISHTHPDHAAGCWIFNELGKDVFSPEGFETTIESLALRFVGEKLSSVWIEFVTKAMGLKDFTSQPYRGGEIILKNPEVEAIHTPGHTADMHAFLIDGRILFGSDIDLTPFGPWYGHEESDLDALVESIHKLSELDAEIFISGHREPIFGRERIAESLERYAEKVEMRNETILRLLSEPKSLEELVKASPIYIKKPFARELMDYWESRMIEKHLVLLRRKGLVREENGLFLANSAADSTA